MFDFDVGKLLLIGVVALIFIPPKDLPEALRMLGRLVGQARRMATEFQGQFNEALREAELTQIQRRPRRPEAKILDGRRVQPRRRHAGGARCPQNRDAGRDPGTAAGPLGAHHCRGSASACARAGACRARARIGAAGRKVRMTQADIDATKAPLIDHLIELRARLIKALVAFLIAFVACFYFSHEIYNILLQPYVRVVGAENAKLIATHFLEQFLTQLKLSMFGAAFIAFPIIALQIYKFVAPGLYGHERRAFAPYLVATPVLFFLGALLVYFVVMPFLIRFSVSFQQLNVKGEATIELLPKVSEYLSLIMTLIFAFGVAFQIAGDPDPARPRRDHRPGISQSEAALCDRADHGGRGDSDAARPDFDDAPLSFPWCFFTKAPYSRWG